MDSPPPPKRRSSVWRILWIAFGLMLLVSIGVATTLGARWFSALDVTLSAALAEPEVEAPPTRLYSRAPHVENGMKLELEALGATLEQLGYRKVAALAGPGTYVLGDESGAIDIRVSALRDASLSGPVYFSIDSKGRVQDLRHEDGATLSRAELEPIPLGFLSDSDAFRDTTRVRLDEVPSVLVDALLAIEDQRFYEHYGIDPVRIFGALMVNVREGGIRQGASTLTQQLVKNRFTGRSRTFTRKIREAGLAMLLEGRMSKDEILEAYLNEIYLGQAGARAIHGVASASRHYFGKPLAEISLPEAALLVGMIRGPTYYDPYRHPERSLARRNVVLDQLELAGLSSHPSEELAAAREGGLGVRERKAPLRSIGFLRQWIAEQKTLAQDEQELPQSSEALVTTLDWRLQALGERVLREGVAKLEKFRPRLKKQKGPLEAALVAIDPSTGEIRALIGGVDFARSQFNRAIDAQRQPGSVFKPVVAAAALEPHRGDEYPPFTLASVLLDEPLIIETDKPGEDLWEPVNHDAEFRGTVTLRQAFEKSLNVPIARLAADVGLRRVVRMARRMGITTRMRAVPSLPLGVYEVSLLEMTRAYSVLAAEGMRSPTRILHGGLNEEGELVRVPRSRPTRAMPASLAYLTNSLLRGVVQRGTGAAMASYGYNGPAAGKTGTTNDYRDAWFIGHTPDLAVGVWVGFDDSTTVGLTGAKAALPMFADFMAGALGKRGGKRFERPGGLERVRVLAQEGVPSGLRCDSEEAREELFLAGTTPSDSCWGAWNIVERRRNPRERDPEVEIFFEPETGSETPAVGAGPPPKREGRDRRGGFFDRLREGVFRNR